MSGRLRWALRNLREMSVWDNGPATREALLDEVRRTVSNARVLEAMGRVPREEFVPEDWRSRAYLDAALPIGAGQTISQPTMVALMSAAADPGPGDRLLEVGAGSGYQAAIFAEMGAVVTGVELVPELVVRARGVLRRLGYGTVTIEEARPGVLGWPQGAPYDIIVVSAAAPRVPAELVDQLAENGRIVVPVGSRTEQVLTIGVKRAGRLDVEQWGLCHWVPLVGPGGFPTH